ncbi:histone-lysine N-methyltransferase 2D-like [Littorina saxatilis]|uniref:histone-lysine N-methyltransferase 2D-like n=1 Tax=Littorina saxatilis TaxID=31220 RepID=UPI0038B684D5
MTDYKAPWTAALLALCAACSGLNITQLSSNVTCDTDHTIITRAVYNDSDIADNNNIQNGDLSRYPALNTTDLMQVYDVCVSPFTDEFLCDAIPGNISVDYDCVQGTVHDPCSSLEDNLQIITLRRHWKAAPASPPWTNEKRECTCKISSPVKQELEFTAVHLYEEHNDSDSLIKIIALSSSPSIYIPLALTPFPRDKKITSDNFTIKFLNGLPTAVQILTITANATSVSIFCEGRDEITPTMQPFSHDVTTVELVDNGTVTLQQASFDFVFPLTGFLVGIMVVAILVILTTAFIVVTKPRFRCLCRRKVTIPLWYRISFAKHNELSLHPPDQIQAAEDSLTTDDLDTPDDYISLPSRPASLSYTSPTYRPESCASMPSFPAPPLPRQRPTLTVTSESTPPSSPPPESRSQHPLPSVTQDPASQKSPPSKPPRRQLKRSLTSESSTPPSSPPPLPPESRPQYPLPLVTPENTASSSLQPSILPQEHPWLPSASESAFQLSPPQPEQHPHPTSPVIPLSLPPRQEPEFPMTPDSNQPLSPLPQPLPRSRYPATSVSQPPPPQDPELSVASDSCPSSPPPSPSHPKSPATPPPSPRQEPQLPITPDSTKRPTPQPRQRRKHPQHSTSPTTPPPPLPLRCPDPQAIERPQLEGSTPFHPPPPCGKAVLPYASASCLLDIPCDLDAQPFASGPFSTEACFSQTLPHHSSLSTRIATMPRMPAARDEFQTFGSPSLHAAVASTPSLPVRGNKPAKPMPSWAM